MGSTIKHAPCSRSYVYRHSSERRSQHVRQQHNTHTHITALTVQSMTKAVARAHQHHTRHLSAPLPASPCSRPPLLGTRCMLLLPLHSSSHVRMLTCSSSSASHLHGVHSTHVIGSTSASDMNPSCTHSSHMPSQHTTAHDCVSSHRIQHSHSMCMTQISMDTRSSCRS